MMTAYSEWVAWYQPKFHVAETQNQHTFQKRKVKFIYRVVVAEKVRSQTSELPLQYQTSEYTLYYKNLGLLTHSMQEITLQQRRNIGVCGDSNCPAVRSAEYP